MAGLAKQQDNTSAAAAGGTPNKLSDEPSVYWVLGLGCDTVMGAARFTAVTTSSSSGGGESIVQYSVCQSMTDVLKAFEVEQSLTAGLLGVGSVSEKVSFLQSQKVTSTSVSRVAIYCKHVEFTETVSSATLQDGIDFNVSKLTDFFMAYGDSFVSSRTLGGEYCAIFVYSTQTVEDQSQLVAAMKVDGIFGSGGSIDSSLGTKLQNFNSSTKVNVSFTQKVTGITNPPLPKGGAQEIIDFALAFPSKQLTSAVVTNFATTGYEHLPEIVGAFQPIPKNRYLIAEDPGFNAKLGQLVGLQNSIAAIKSIYTFYGGYQDVKLEQVGNDADADKQSFINMVNNYEKDPTAEVVQPVLTSISNGTPQILFVSGESGSYGGPRGDEFDDVQAGVISDYLVKNTRITAIQLRTGDVIDKLMTTYSDGQALSHGQNGGSLQLQATLDAGTSVSGTQAWIHGSYCVASLGIGLSDGSKVPGYDPDHGGDHFSWTVPDNSFVVGFRGRSGWYLDQLRIAYVSFQPALWTTQS